VKRLITITIAVIMLLMPAQTLAEAKGPLSFERAVALLKLNSSTLINLQRAENDAYKQYQSNVLQAGNIDINGFTTEFNGKEFYITYGADTRLMMTKAKELGPEQMKFSWEASRDNRIVTENTLKTALRGVFLGLYSAQNDIQLKQKQLALTTEINKQNALKLEKGMITALDMEESGYNLLKAQKDLDAANRNYANAVRNFNQFVGLPTNNGYTQIIDEDILKRPILKPVEAYVDAALANRFDIVSIQKQLALKEEDKKITDTGFDQKTNTSAQDSYESMLNDIEQLNVDLEGMKLTITDEIKNAYVDVISTGKSLDSMYNTVKLQRSNYEKMKARYDSGMISMNVLTQTELGLLQVENGYKAMIFDYNTKITSFNNATGIGPAY
jgi:outer membrane protein TolC